MAYLTREEVLDMYSSLKELYDGERVSGEQIDKWIAESASIIDSKIGTRYQLPFTSTPPLIATIAIEIFEYFWQKNQYTPTASGDEVPWLYTRYDKIIKLLDQISDGKVLLFDDDGEEVTTSSRKLGLIDSNHYESDPIFTMDNAEDQEIPDDYGEIE